MRNPAPLGPFFRAIVNSNFDFLETMQQLLNKDSVYGDEYCSCQFVNSNDKESSDDVKFVHDDFLIPERSMQVTICYEEFLTFLKMAATLYVEFHPDDAAKVREMFIAKGIESSHITTSAQQFFHFFGRVRVIQ